MAEIAQSIHALQAGDGGMGSAAMYSGLLLALLLYHLLLSATERDRCQFYHLGFVASFGVAALALQGVVPPPLNALHPSVSALALPLSLGVAGACLAGLARHLLHLPAQWPGAHHLMQGLPWLFTPILPLLWLGQDGWAVQWGVTLHVLMSAALLLITARLRRHRSAPALYVFAAGACLMAGLLGTALDLFATSLAPSHNAQGLLLGSGVAFVFLSLALAKRQGAQTAPAPSSATQLIELEARVKTKTLDLDKALAELQVAHSQLDAQATQDALTGLHSRHFLSDRMPEIWGTAVRWRQHVAMLMVDIDHLHRINEQHGRSAGDDALKAVATVITQVIRRPSDHALRFGAEEFLVVLPQTHAAGAAHMAERIRAEVAGLTLTHGGKRVPLTVSIGVACATPGPRTAMNLMLQLADRLLHQAKSEGRNRCILQPTALAQLTPPEIASPVRT